MNKKIKCLIAVSLLMMVALVAAGCGSSQTAAPTHKAADSARNADSGHNMDSKMPMEDPSVFVKDMQQTMMMITEQTKLNKLDDAKKAAAELVALHDKLAVHVTDAKLNEDLHQGVLNLQAEVQKTSPSQSAIDKQMEAVKKLLNEVSSQIKNHKHQ